MSQTTGEFIVDRLRQWNVDRVFGYPGDGINGVFAALRKAADENRPPRFIQARHEEMAAFMACAHAKFTGEVGVCIATSGPGAIHLLNGLYDAKMDHQPVVAIVGQSATTAHGQRLSAGSRSAQSVQGRGERILPDRSIHPIAARHVIDRAIRIALDQNTVTCVILPKDVQEEKAVLEPPQKHDTAQSGIGIRGAAHDSASGGAGAGGGGAQPRACGACWSAQARSRPLMKSSKRRSCSARASLKRGSAKRSFRTTFRSAPARSACSAPDRVGS